MYNWYAVGTHKLAPEGWHVATDKDWTDLADYLGNDSAGKKIKDTSLTYWFNNYYANNETGFSAFPGGFRDVCFNRSGYQGIFWTSTENVDDPTMVWYRYVDYSGPGLPRYDSEKYFGLSVRCIRD